MSKPALRIVLSVLVLGAGVAAWHWGRVDAPAGPAAPSRAASDAAAKSPQATPPPSSSAASSTSQSAQSSSNRSIGLGGPIPTKVISNTYERETDRRALFEKLAPSTDRDAPYFAAKILRECADVSNRGLDALQREFESRASAVAELRNKQSDAFHKLKSPCASFFGRQITPEEIEQLEAEGVKRGDPRAMARALALGKLDMQTDTHQLAGQILDSGDGYAIADLATWLAQQRGRVTIMGTPVASADVVAANLAWQMVACDQGLPCGADHPQVLSSCAFDGVCGKSNYEDLVRTTMLNAQQYQRMLEFRARIIAALQAKDYASLGI